MRMTLFGMLLLLTGFTALADEKVDAPYSLGWPTVKFQKTVQSANTPDQAYGFPLRLHRRFTVKAFRAAVYTEGKNLRMAFYRTADRTFVGGTEVVSTVPGWNVAKPSEPLTLEPGEYFLLLNTDDVVGTKFGYASKTRGGCTLFPLSTATEWPEATPPVGACIGEVPSIYVTAVRATKEGDDELLTF